MIEEQAPNRGKHSKTLSLANSNMIVIFIGLVVLCGLSFYGGVAYQKGKKDKITTVSTSGLRDSQFGPGNRMNGERPISGEVTTVSATSITINNAFTGSASTYTISDSTKITDNGQTVTISDIKSGDRVAVMTSSGSTTQASEILINPSFGRGMGGPQTGTTQVDDTGLSTQ